MTEAEWLACQDPLAMLEFLRGKVSDRKLRLFACACCRRAWPFLTNIHSRGAVDAAERFADCLITRKELEAAGARAGAAARYGPARLAARLGRVRIGDVADDATNNVSVKVAILMLRDIFNHFCPVLVEHFWLAWNDGAIHKIAQAIYDDRAFDRLPLLADALEDAGCDNADILSHCRAPGEHVRGCWVVDLLLGKS